MKKVIPGLKFHIMLDIIYAIIFPLAIGVYILRRKYHWGCRERIGGGYWKKILKTPGSFIWIHAVSLGEARITHLVYTKLKQICPACKFLLTTVTTTGYRFLKQNVNGDDFVAYLPLDFLFLIKRVFEKLDIRLLLILETELWPNLIISSKRYNCITGLINARISKKSFPRYRRFSFLFSKVINCLDFVVAAGDHNLTRFLAVGRKDEDCYSIPSLKFDLDAPILKDESRLERLKIYLEEKNLKLLVAGSTHYPEDILMLKLYLQIKETYPDWALLIVPRHPDRMKNLREFLSSHNISASFFSQSFQGIGDTTIFILDDTGYLATVYSLGDLIFVGGSLIPRGGHNIIEPAIFKKSIFIGPYYYNFEDIVEEFKKNDAVVIVDKDRPVLPQVQSLIADEKLRLQLGEKAYRVVKSNQGNIEKLMDIIKIYFQCCQ